MKTIKPVFALLKQTFDEWNEDNAPRLAAALAYYTVFSIAPLLVVVIAIAGLVFGHEAVTHRLDDQIRGLVGPEGAAIIQEIVRNASQPREGIVATLLGLATLILGAIGVFMQLKSALNTIWEVPPSPGQGILKTISDHLVSFGMVLGVGFVLLVALVVSAVLSALSNFVNGLLPQAQFVTQLFNFVLSFGVVTVLFALMFKYLPDATPAIDWRDVWIGAAMTALLFTIGKHLLGLYLGNSGVTSSYGAAGSFVLVLLWIYYSAQIFLFGAEFTQVYAQKYGSRLVSAAQPVPEIGAVESVGDLEEQSKAWLAAETAPIDMPAENITFTFAPPPKDTLSPGQRIGAVVGFIASLAGFIALFIRSKQNQSS